MAVSVDSASAQGADICQKCKRARIDDPRHGPDASPGYHHGDERWCEACYYDFPIESMPIAHGSQP